MLEQDADEVSVYFKNEISGLLHQLLEFLKEFKIEKSDNAHINLIITLPQASIFFTENRYSGRIAWHPDHSYL